MALPTFVAAGGSATAGAGTVTPSLPAGLAADDILLLSCETGITAATDAPSGYGTVTAFVENTNGNGSRLNLFWKRATGGEVAPDVVNTTNHIIAQLAAFRGCITSGNPWDVVSSGFFNSNHTTGTATGTTTTGNDRLIAVYIGTGEDTAVPQLSAWANASLANVTERLDSFTTSGHGGGFGMATGELATAGAYGDTTATHSNISDEWMTVALMPPAAPVVASSAVFTDNYIIG